MKDEKVIINIEQWNEYQQLLKEKDGQLIMTVDTNTVTQLVNTIRNMTNNILLKDELIYRLQSGFLSWLKYRRGRA